MHTLAPRIVAGLLLGAAAGAAAHALGVGEPFVRYLAHPVGQIWLNLLLVWMLPLASAALVLGLLGLEPGQVARTGGRIVFLTFGLTGIAVLIGLAVVTLIAPGVGIDPATLPAGDAPKPAEGDGIDLLIAQFPRNPIAAAAGDSLVPALIFALLFGLALRTTATPGAERVTALIQGIFEVSVRGVEMILWLAPLGVAMLTARMAAKGGLAALVPLLWFVAAVLLALGLQMFVVYPIVLKAMARRDPGAFFAAVRPAMLVAFSTASSAATLPTSLHVAEHRLGLPAQTARFVLTIGATGNQNGTALFEGVAVLFLAQLYGVELGLMEQAGVVLVSVLAGIGTAGVPSGSLPVVTAIVVALGMPADAVGVIVGVDRLLDMARTTLNVVGDLVIAAAVTPGDEPGRDSVTS
jgi:DAACS family dicarboxylate/amino acid:cation (Na+ or H+) symporter